jgi:hypothetical protein
MISSTSESSKLRRRTFLPTSNCATPCSLAICELLQRVCIQIFLDRLSLLGFFEVLIMLPKAFLSAFSGFSSSDWASFLAASTYLSVPAFFRYASSPTLVKALFGPSAGSNWFTKRSHGKSTHSPQWLTECLFAQVKSWHSPQKGCPFSEAQPEQCGVFFFV